MKNVYDASAIASLLYTQVCDYPDMSMPKEDFSLMLGLYNSKKPRRYLQCIKI